jgi:hypothetical protein
LKLMLSLRAALYNLIGNETSPNVRCPFQTVDAIAASSRVLALRRNTRYTLLLQTLCTRLVNRFYGA